MPPMSLLRKWYVRAVIAVLGATIICTLTNAVWINIFNTAFVRSLSDTAKQYLHFFSLAIFPMVICLSVYGILSYCLSPNNQDNETRCRQCGYILRGITEPRCPECGERI